MKTGSRDKYIYSKFKEPEKEANELINTFASRCNPTNLPQHTQELQQNLLQDRENNIALACDEEDITDTPFTLLELKNSINNKKDTAAGMDKITFSMIREAGDKAQEEILHLVNTSFI